MLPILPSAAEVTQGGLPTTRSGPLSRQGKSVRRSRSKRLARMTSTRVPFDRQVRTAPWPSAVSCSSIADHLAGADASFQQGAKERPRAAGRLQDAGPAGAIRPQRPDDRRGQFRRSLEVSQVTLAPGLPSACGGTFRNESPAAGSVT